MNDDIGVMLVEDHPEYREVVGLALTKEQGMELTSRHGTAERALRYLRELQVEERPDVILLDLGLPGMGGLEAISPIKVATPESRIIILTQSDRHEDVLKAISLGASGYLLKSSTVKQITNGIRSVTSGGASLDARVARFVLDTLKSKLPSDADESLLTQRELEVLGLLAKGLVKKEIADQLSISTNTVVTHVSHIYGKLDAPNAPAAIAKAFQTGILPLKMEE